MAPSAGDAGSGMSHRELRGVQGRSLPMDDGLYWLHIREVGKDSGRGGRTRGREGKKSSKDSGGGGRMRGREGKKSSSARGGLYSWQSASRWIRPADCGGEARNG